MNSEPRYESEFNSNENERISFSDKFRDLLPGVTFEEPAEIRDARVAVIEALLRDDNTSEFLQSVWIEYAKTWEQLVDSDIAATPHIRAQLQIAALVHKALVFREVGNGQRYIEDLNDAKVYAYNMDFDEIAEVIRTELDSFTY